MGRTSQARTPKVHFTIQYSLYHPKRPCERRQATIETFLLISGAACPGTRELSRTRVERKKSH